MQVNKKIFLFLVQIPILIQAQEPTTNVPPLVLQSQTPAAVPQVRIEELMCKMDKERLTSDNAKLADDLVKANQKIEKLLQDIYVLTSNFNNQHVDLEVTKTKLEFCESNKTLQIVFGSVSTLGSIVAGTLCTVRDIHTPN